MLVSKPTGVATSRAPVEDLYLSTCFAAVSTSQSYGWLSGLVAQ